MVMDKNNAALDEAANRILSARRLVVFTGAGVSRESGIPTFRDAQTGLWANDSPEDLATREGFLRNPQRVWSWYDFRRNGVWMSDPNPGHYALARLEQEWSASDGRSFLLITQNIDNLHERAGSRNVLELHGNIFRYKCLDAGHAYTLDPEPHPGVAVPPRCPVCDSYIRPDVVWFGEMLNPNILETAFQSAEAAEVMLIVGTSGVVQPAASLPILAKRAGAFLVEVNPEPSGLTPGVDIFLEGPSGIILPDLQNRLSGLLFNEKLSEREE